MTQPPDFVSYDKILVCKLKKAIYGLKQTLRAWHEKLTQALLQFGLTTLKCDNSLFIYYHQGISLYVLVYVDDILIIGSNYTLIHYLINKMHTTFALKKLGRPSYFLGIEIKFHNNGSLEDLLSRAKMDNVNGIPTPVMRTCKLSNHGTNHFFDPSLYRSIVSVLHFDKAKYCI